MRIYILAFLAVATCFNCYSQSSTIEITLENTININIETLRFFNQPDNSSLEQTTPEQFVYLFHRGETLPKSADFNVTKIDDNHYLLKYRSDKPEMVYLNYKPIYIKPGDNVQLTYKVITKTYDTLRDTLFTTAKHFGNYVFSNFIDAEKIGRSPNFNAVKYKKDKGIFYTDLVNFYH